MRGILAAVAATPDFSLLAPDADGNETMVMENPEMKKLEESLYLTPKELAHVNVTAALQWTGSQRELASRCQLADDDMFKMEAISNPQP